MTAPRASTGQVVIRDLHTLDELNTAVRLQKEVWNFADNELVPLRLFVVAGKVGGQTIGAFDGDEMVGFVFGIPGVRHGHCYLHSHMMGVRERYRNTGLGRRLKLFQRDEALAHGFELVEWTFDPLEIKNAWLNLVKLGAITRRYVINQYGITSSPLQGGLPSDRFVAEWWLRSGRVESLVSEGHAPPFDVEQTVTVPAEIYQWKADPKTRQLAADVQLRNRELLMRAFADGLAVLGFERNARGDGKYLLGRWDEKWSYA